MAERQKGQLTLTLLNQLREIALRERLLWLKMFENNCYKHNINPKGEAGSTVE